MKATTLSPPTSRQRVCWGTVIAGEPFIVAANLAVTRAEITRLRAEALDLTTLLAAMADGTHDPADLAAPDVTEAEVAADLRFTMDRLSRIEGLLATAPAEPVPAVAA